VKFRELERKNTKLGTIKYVEGEMVMESMNMIKVNHMHVLECHNEASCFIQLIYAYRSAVKEQNSQSYNSAEIFVMTPRLTDINF
jgi:hypothetical protein